MEELITLAKTIERKFKKAKGLKKLEATADVDAWVASARAPAAVEDSAVHYGVFGPSDLPGWFQYVDQYHHASWFEPLTDDAEARPEKLLADVPTVTAYDHGEPQDEITFAWQLDSFREGVEPA